MVKCKLFLVRNFQFGQKDEVVKRSDINKRESLRVGLSCFVGFELQFKCIWCDFRDLLKFYQQGSGISLED